MLKAFVLHGRDFSETSVLLHIFTEELGVLSVIAKGAKRPKSKWRGILQPFILLQVEIAGKNELKNLVQAEALQSMPVLIGKMAFFGFYINELILRLLKMQAPQAEIFNDYCNVLHELNATNDLVFAETYLRIFEYQILLSLGYGIDLAADSRGNPIYPEVIYQYDGELGLCETEILPQSKQIVVVSGASILALKENRFTNSTQLKEAKLLMRACLKPHIGDKPFKSRLLFKKIHSKEGKL